MPKQKQAKMRVTDYFKFADAFDGSQSATNYHYSDLLRKLSTGQSNKLTKIATLANSLYDTRNNHDTVFSRSYKQYWEVRNDSDSLEKTLRKENQETIVQLNKLTNNNIRRLAKKAHIADETPESIETVGKVKDLEDSTDESDKTCDINTVLSQTANLASDEVGKLNIIDLSSLTTLDILEAETSKERLDVIIEATKTKAVQLSLYAKNLITELCETTWSVQALRKTLHQTVFHEDFDLIAHSDFGFIEVTTRYFLDIMSSPQNPFNNVMLERTAASYLIIYIVNQLFLSNNDVIELGWLEREFYLTDRTKFDGILFKVGNKTICPALVEFSGGINDHTSLHKNSNDIKKLYFNMAKIMTETKTESLFCIRFYGHTIFFEKLVKYEDNMYRIVDATIEVPNTPRKLVAFIKKIPLIVAWKQAVIDYVID
ncbi:hypothetical protein F4703DRAFT_1915457 [Phycomyces blakesleeanus]